MFQFQEQEHLKMVQPEVLLDEQTSSSGSSYSHPEALPHLIKISDIIPPKSSFPSPKNTSTDGARVNFFVEATRALQRSSIELDAEDCFAKHVALTLKKLPNTDREDAKLDIQNILACYMRRKSE